MDIIRGIEADRKRALEITESVATGSPFDRIRASEANGIESRLSQVHDAIKDSSIKIEKHTAEEIIKKIEEGLSAVRGTREIARLRAIGKQKKADENSPEKQGHFTEEEIAEKLGLGPEIAKRIKENPEAVMKEAQITMDSLREKRAIRERGERAEAARKKERSMEQSNSKKKRFMG